MLHRPRKIFDKETVNAGSPRDRLILELQTRCNNRIEVLHPKSSYLPGIKIVIQEPKSGRDADVAFMPEHIEARLVEYVAAKQLLHADRMFPLCYEGQVIKRKPK